MLLDQTKGNIVVLMVSETKFEDSFSNAKSFYRWWWTYEIEVLSTSAIKCQGKIRIFQFAWAIRRQKNCQRLSRNLCLHHVGNGFGIPSAILPRTMIWIFSSWYYLLYRLLLTYLKGRNRRQCFSRWSSCFGCFVCPCYNKRTHYPTLEKLGAPNVTACENQGKPRELSDHWK